MLFLEAILSKRNAVGEIADHLESNPWLQKWVELESIHESSLNRKLNDVPTDRLCQTYVELVEHFTRDFGFPSTLKGLGALSAVDSTSITIGKTRGEWAHLQSNKNAVKVHTCLRLTSEQSGIPTATVLSTGSVADLDHEVVDHLIWEEDITYLMDRGYIDYGQFLKWNREGISFVARLKANSRVRVLSEREIGAGAIEKDEEVELQDPSTGEVGIFRLVTYTFKDEKGKEHRVRALTNRWDLTASEVAQAYRYRWKVEIFFKLMKQRLHLKKVYSAKPTAVWNQIFLNLIAYLLCEYCRNNVAPDAALGKMMSKMRHYLMRPWCEFVKVMNPIPQRTSKGRRNKGGRPRLYKKKIKKERRIFKG